MLILTFQQKFHFFSIGRMILTKAPNTFDPDGDSDRQDVIDAYKGQEGLENWNWPWRAFIKS